VHFCAGSHLKQPRSTRHFMTAAAFVVFGLLGFGTSVQSRNQSIQLAIPVQQLPQEAQTTLQLIEQGGPFPYAKDDSVFANRERQLPQARRGYYREYTVPTPGAHDRGARRIVCGQAQTPSAKSCFYTSDHYSSFHPIVP
jgi:ribonuclease T1